ncbi:MAG: DUF4127 family protein [Parcubacteria group bacterium]|nr:DUF4127 family protein [Parcubacteria group bacterium]
MKEEETVEAIRKVAIIPIDSRPPTSEFPVSLGTIAGVKVTTPPASILKEGLAPVRENILRAWVQNQVHSGIDTFIFSIDRLCYGGLFSSRTHLIDAQTAKTKLRFFTELRRTCPHKTIHAFVVLPRLNPVEGLAGTSWKEVFAGTLATRWARQQNPTLTKAALGLIAKEKLQDYIAMRQRNLDVILETLRFVFEGDVDFLAIALDDTAPTGVHRREIAEIEKEIWRLSLGGRVSILPGTDETALLLLCRTLLENTLLENAYFMPRVLPIFSSRQGPDLIGHFEDRPMRELIKAHVQLANGVLVASHEEADLLLFVHTPQDKQQHHWPTAKKTDLSSPDLQTFVTSLDHALRSGKAAALIDVAYSNGADPDFLAHIKTRLPLASLASYAAWNTSGNAIGSGVSHAFLRLYMRRIMKTLSHDEVRQADLQHYAELFARLLDDGEYQGEIRQRVHLGFGKKGIVCVDERGARTVKSALKARARLAFRDHFADIRLLTGERISGVSLEISFPLQRYFEISLHVRFRLAPS